ncbi:MAG: B12-binding domain-containing radical SAM protein, partial [Candidatus Binatia bacterium]
MDQQSEPSVRQEVTLVRPAKVSSAGSWSLPVSPPLGLAYVAAVLREHGHRVSCLDAIAERIDQFIHDDDYLSQGLTIEETVERIDPDSTIIGVSGMFTQDWPHTRQLCSAIRAKFPAALLVGGGEHFTALPEFSLRDCPELDLCVLGEGEETMLDIANCFADWDRLVRVSGIAYLDGDRYVQTAPRGRIQAVNDMPYPAWDLFPVEVYLSDRNAYGVYRGRSLPILATRGCPYKCTFCSNPAMYGVLWIPRDPADVMDEIEFLLNQYRVQNVDFYDLTMVLKKDWILQFCRLIEERGLQLTWQLPSGTRSEVIDDEVSAALYRTGCRNVTYAPESGSVKTLKAIKKQVHLDRLIASIRSAVRNGIHVKCNIIIGFPHDTRSDLLKTIWLCWKFAVLGVDASEIFLFTPYPGTELFNELRADGTIGELDGNYFRSLVAFLDPFRP